MFMNRPNIYLPNQYVQNQDGTLDLSHWAVIFNIALFLLVPLRKYNQAIDFLIIF